MCCSLHGLICMMHNVLPQCLLYAFATVSHMRQHMCLYAQASVSARFMFIDEQTITCLWTVYTIEAGLRSGHTTNLQ